MAEDREQRYDDPEPWASRFFGSRSLVKVVAWVVIAALVLVPGALQLIAALDR